jgi:cytochrome c oxidase assembly protein subunit 15
VGIVQYALKLPAGIVWVHIALAVLTWLCVLWSVGAAGRIQPAARGPQPADEAPPRELVTSAG